MTGLTTFAIAGVLGTLALPILLPAPATTAAGAIAVAARQSRAGGTRPADARPSDTRTTDTRATTPPRAAAEMLRYRVTIDQQEKAYNGKVSKKPTGRIETVVSGTDSRAEVVAGDKDLKTGDVLLTNDGGETIYWIRGRSYVLMDAAYRERITREVTGKMKMTIANGQVDVDPSGGNETIAGLSAAHGRMSRSFDLGVKVMLMSVKVAYEDHLDVWTASDLAGAPSIEAAFYNVFINMVPAADEGLRADTAAASAKMPQGFVMKWSHASVTRKDDGSTEEGETTFVVSDLKRGAAAGVDAGGFELPAGLRRVEKW